MQELKYRNEYKHIINKNHAVVLKSRLKALLKADPFANENGEYFIRSLYFDTYDNRALSEKFDGVPFRSKYRIRFYDHDTSAIKLENKIKCYNSTAKLFCGITKEEVYKILAHDIDFLKKSNEPLQRTFYQELAAGSLVPKTIVDYIRTPFVYPHGNVRITIDSDIRSPAGYMGVDIFDPNAPTVSVYPDERCVLEVKYDDFIPDFVYKIIQVEVTSASAMSKYASCRRFV